MTTTTTTPSEPIGIKRIRVWYNGDVLCHLNCPEEAVEDSVRELMFEFYGGRGANNLDFTHAHTKHGFGDVYIKEI